MIAASGLPRHQEQAARIHTAPDGEPGHPPASPQLSYGNAAEEPALRTCEFWGSGDPL
jgi:hypothetical protein